jgi:hypothetical protein
MRSTCSLPSSPPAPAVMLWAAKGSATLGLHVRPCKLRHAVPRTFRKKHWSGSLTLRRLLRRLRGLGHRERPRGEPEGRGCASLWATPSPECLGILLHPPSGQQAEVGNVPAMTDGRPERRFADLPGICGFILRSATGKVSSPGEKASYRGDNPEAGSISLKSKHLRPARRKGSESRAPEALQVHCSKGTYGHAERTNRGSGGSPKAL